MVSPVENAAREAPLLRTLHPRLERFGLRADLRDLVTVGEALGGHRGLA